MSLLGHNVRRSALHLPTVAVGRREIHAAGFEQMLINCGGLQAVRKYPELEVTIYE